MSRLIPPSLFGIIHITFLIGVVFFNWGWIALVGLLPILGYSVFEFKKADLNISQLILTIFIFALGFIVTQLITNLTGVSNVFSSALVGLIASFLRWKKVKDLPAIIYSGSFAGMVSFSHVQEIWVLSSVCLLGGVLFFLLRDSFNGLGGKLGSIGFGALLIPIIINEPNNMSFENCFRSDYNMSFGTLSSLTITILIAVFITGIVYWINNKTLNPIRASALISFALVIPFELLNAVGFLALIPGLVFGASFVGMTSKKVLKLPSVLFSGFVFGLAFYLLQDSFNGFGGTLGTTACLSCLVGVLTQKAFKRQPVRI